ncbi:MAG: LysM peptidoglycan-binding domain-containing protein, partial [Pseudomonadales bacterium]|nr:LysM peptidoglycan-binding domain-containing protein [Pseudomonadales bacterium]
MPEANLKDGEYGVTGAGDTLWSIAMRVQPVAAVSVQQTMLALQRANPDAFVNNNINLLKAGYVLRIPEGQEFQRETAASALEQVRAQNDEFDAYRRGQPLARLDASARQRSGNEPPADDDSDVLKLLAAEQRSADAGERAGAGASKGSDGALEESLALARENLDLTQRANSDLTARLDDLADQIETLNEIVKLKDDQLAALRAEIQKTQAAAATAPATATTPAAAASNAGLLANPFVLAGLGILLIGAVAGGLIYRKRRQDQRELGEDGFDDSELEEDALAAVAPAAEQALAVTDDDYDEDVSPETTDVLGEVEIYIAYGRFPQASNFLQKAIQAEPERTDLRLKLLEVYVQTQDGVAFNLQLEQLRAIADAATLDKALALQAKIPGAAATTAAISPAPVGLDDDDLSFDLDGLDSDLENSKDLDLDLDL